MTNPGLSELTRAHRLRRPAAAILDAALSDLDRHGLQASGPLGRSRIRATGTAMVAALMLLRGSAPAAAATPEFAEPVLDPFGIVSPCVDIVAPSLADIDGDGDLDLFVGATEDTGGAKYSDSYFYENVGDAANPVFDTAQHDPFALGSIVDTSTGLMTATELPVRRQELVDLNSDDLFDIYDVIPAGGSLFVAAGYDRFHANVGSAFAPAFADPVVTRFGLTFTGDLVTQVYSFGDLNGDTLPDVVLGTRNGYLGLALNVGDASNPWYSTPTPIAGASLVRNIPALADLEGDGDLDLVVGQSGSSAGDVLVFVNEGNGTAPAFTTLLTNPYGLVGSGDAIVPAFADIDDDGDMDAFLGESCGIRFFRNDALKCPLEQARIDDCALTATGGKFQLFDKDGAPDKDKIAFSVTHGEVYDQSDLGDPGVSTDYVLCVYDQAGGATHSLVRHFDVPAGSPGWVSKDPKGWQFKNKTGINGIQQIKLLSGKPKVRVKGKGAGLGLPGAFSVDAYFEQDAAVRVQLRNSDGACWDLELPQASTTKNTAEHFKATIKP